MRKTLLALGLATGLYVASAVPARADPVTAAISAIVTTVSSWMASSAIAAFVVRGAIAVGLSILSKALGKGAGSSSAAASGVKAQTSSGGATDLTFILGDYATAGHLIAPLMSFGDDGGTPNAYLVYVIALGCIPGTELKRVIINDEYVTFGATAQTVAGSIATAYPIEGIYAGNAWIRYHDGHQTAADAFLVEKLSSYPDRPWSSDMIGFGVPYAVLIFRYNREVLNSPPSVKFELGGIPLYDPRKDTTVGGAGAQRWGEPETYTASDNPVVQIYNIHRGIRLLDGSIWGGESEADELPLDNWFAAMNDCDMVVDLGGGETEAAYRAGLEVSVSDEPAAVIEALENACMAQQVEIGGIWKIRVGGPGLPVMSFTDDDILIDHDQNHDLFPSLNELHNGIQATHPLPASLWATTDAPPLLNATWEAQDGGRQLVANLNLPPVGSPTQVQRIMKASIEEERRMGRHALSFGPYASMLEPLDTVVWTSTKQGYTAKAFEVNEVNESLLSLNVAVGLRERDAGDYVPPVTYLPVVPVPTGTTLPVAQAVPGWTVGPASIRDGDDTPRKPAIAMGWDSSKMLYARAIMWQVRVKLTLADVASGTASDVAANGIVMSEGLSGSTVYQARGRQVSDLPTDWTAWIDVTTPNIKISENDLADSVVNTMNTSLEETLRTRLSLDLFRQVQQALNYGGDGQSTQFKAINALEQATTAMTTLNVMGALVPGGSAFVMDMTKVQAEPGVSFASKFSGIQSSLNGLTSSVSTLAEAFDGIGASFTLAVNGSGNVAGLKAIAGPDISALYFVANTFGFVDPSDPDNKIVPLSYTGGRWRFASNVTIDGDLVVTGSITNAALAQNAALAIGPSEWSGSMGGDGSWKTIISTSHAISRAGYMLVIGTATQNFSSDVSWEFEVSIDGVVQPNPPYGTKPGDSVALSDSEYITTAKTVAIVVRWKADGGCTLRSLKLTKIAVPGTV